MNLFNRKKVGRLLLPALATLLCFGSLPALAQEDGVSSSASISSDAQTPSGIGLQDAERLEILRNARALYQFNEHYKSSFETQGLYSTYKQTSFETFAIAFNPNSTRSDLTAASQRLDAFPPYELFWDVGGSGLDAVLFEAEMQLHLYTEFGSESGQWSEAVGEQWMNEIALIRDEFYQLMYNWDEGQEAWRLYWEYLNAMADFEDKRNGRTDIWEQTFQTRADVLNRVAAGQLSREQTAEFDSAVQKLETLLAALGSPEEIQAAFSQVQSAYEALPSSGNPGTSLAADIEAAHKLLDLPKGIRSGQYPASAFGTLRRAINEAQLSLTRGGTEAQLKQAQDKLASSVADFLSRKKP
ncbi:hypothetical protein [Saccharibacillus kuerlensis]|uniref:DUF3829 domain-containing protein n=1 Tax=Saccharibacillus kuerlensis TaxID=459527 RepID=A0ABQ2L526_9BACL|nr:hypothetical protein [Saccharibacillus kuerlensis]GGO03856.1 hypothetical protein GCM10010969_28470 [Saccharibacillus kuerlensis]